MNAFTRNHLLLLTTLAALAAQATAFAPASFGRAFGRHSSPVRRSHLRAAEEPPRSPEEVTEKFGLEAGLFSAFRSAASGDEKKGSMATAGDLLKRYGGAYLLTSTSLALVSFSLCYLAVDNGVDIASLLGKVGIEVSSTSETVGTVGIAYAIHKAASPIRFPPTVALTPVVARKVFGKQEEAEEPEA
jgi:hypothetical protein